MDKEWVTSKRETIWEISPGKERLGTRVMEGYGQVDTDGHLRSVNGLDPIGFGVIRWGGNFGGLYVFRTEADALRDGISRLDVEIAELTARRTEYATRLAATETPSLEGARRVEPATGEHEPPTPAPNPRSVQLGSQGDSAHTPKTQGDEG